MGVLILGTDFRHAVEFSRSGRARSPADCSTVLRGGDFHCTPGSAAIEPRGFDRRFPRPWSPVRSRSVREQPYTRFQGRAWGARRSRGKDPIGDFLIAEDERSKRPR